MQGVPQAFDAPVDRAEFKAAPHRAGIELYRAHIVHHRFEPHAHAAFGLGAIAGGVERFRYRGSELRAPAGSLVLMNPDELHTGHAESEEGWRYRMLYLDEGLLAEISGERGWHFPQGVVHDAARAGRVNGLLHRLWLSDEPLAFDSTLAELVQALRPLARVGRPTNDGAAPAFAGVIEYMHEHLEHRLTLAELAGVAGLSPFHFLRSFRARHHATPQQMLMALRLLAAKQQLADGVPPAEVAAAVGLADQAPLPRAFARRYGTTPARYAQQSGSRRGRG
jgi:AraC-like DNA-binding protein